MNERAPTSTGEPALLDQPRPVQQVERRPPLPALTGLRTLLALLILLFHFTPAGLRSERFPWLSLYPLVDIGYVFVSFFFLISGFILSYNYAHRPGRINAVDFWMARFSRLYPVYALAMRCAAASSGQWKRGGNWRPGWLRSASALSYTSGRMG